MFKWYDYMIIIIPVICVFAMGIYVRRFIKGVADFLSAGRLAGRYLMACGDVANALSIITLLSYVEIHYKTGFALAFWNSTLLPIGIFLGLAGYCTYRFRETKAMSIGQFIEMRYSRNLRIFAAALRSISEMLANMIMPALAARFFINFLGLPSHFTFLGIRMETFVVIMVVSLVMAISIILMGGMLSIMVTDSLQGLFLYPLLVTFVIFILTKFSWSKEISVAMMDRGPGESFINPFDLKNLRDFNFLMFGGTVLSTFLHRASWFASGSTVARSAHEQKMAGLLGSWRQTMTSVFYVLIAIGIITILNHVDFAPKAKEIRNELVTKVANDVIKDEKMRAEIIDAAAAIPVHHHTYGVDEPLTDKKNLDTPYLEAAEGVMQSHEDGMKNYPQFKALYFQLMTTVTLRNILPNGMLGLFVLMMILAMVSTDDSRIYSAAATIMQDVILPLKKGGFTPKQHLWCIRGVAIGIGVFFLIGSYYMSQMDYISLFVAITTALWLGGCGPVLTFGLYSRFGTTAGAWTSLITGATFSVIGQLMQRNWANHIYPWLDRHGWVEPVGNFLTRVSKPLNPIVVWEMSQKKFPINSYEISLFTTIVCLILYCVVSKLTCKEPFNLDRMLHRGIYAEPGKIVMRTDWSIKNIGKRLIGITPEYSKGDKCIAWALFIYSFGYSFLGMFVLPATWNTLARIPGLHIKPWPVTWWSNYYCLSLLIVPATIASISLFWFGIGGVRNMFELIRDLKKRVVNNLDDGRVEGNVSLADKAQFEEAEKRQGAKEAK